MREILGMLKNTLIVWSTIVLGELHLETENE